MENGDNDEWYKIASFDLDNTWMKFHKNKKNTKKGDLRNPKEQL